MGQVPNAEGVLLHASHSHLFRGARLEARGATPQAPATAGGAPTRTDEALTCAHPGGNARTDVLVVFSDFSAAEATLAQTAGTPGWLLSVAAYRTDSGTDIAARAWALELLPAQGAPMFKVVARAEPGAR
ncbi:hypothetical protein BJH93_07175 [Kocuria polaris]|nr:hypothetical protein [Kocuria polaris]